MKYEVNTPQPKRNQKKLEAMHKEREALLLQAKEALTTKSAEEVIEMLIDHFLTFKHADKPIWKNFTAPIFFQAVTFKKNSADARRDAAHEQFKISAKAFGKKLIDNHIELNERLTAGKCIQKLRAKGVPDKEIPDDKTARGYIKYLAASAKVTKIKKVL